MNLSFEPRTIFASAPDSECLLALQDRMLVALLIRVGDINGDYEGGWFIEWAAHDEIASHEIFPDLESASDWICRQLEGVSKSRA